MDKLLTLEEAAAYLKVHPRSITRAIESGKLKALRAGHLWRFREKDLLAYLEAGAKSVKKPKPEEK